MLARQNFPTAANNSILRCLLFRLRSHESPPFPGDDLVNWSSQLGIIHKRHLCQTQMVPARPWHHSGFNFQFNCDQGKCWLGLDTFRKRSDKGLFCVVFSLSLSWKFQFLRCWSGNILNNFHFHWNCVKIELKVDLAIFCAALPVAGANPLSNFRSVKSFIENTSRKYFMFDVFSLCQLYAI